jgi:ribosomal protein L11 methyltransferase
VGRRLRVLPPWLDGDGAAPAPGAEDRVTVVIEPGRAFGTGHHGTTEGCLVLLEEALAAAPGAAVLDIGTGTGILAIAALRLGAPRVLAIDLDPDAVAATRVNAERNGCAGLTVRLAEPPEIDEAAPIVVANLLTHSHLALAAQYARLVAPGGQLVLGGMLEDEDDRVTAALAAAGFERRARVALEGWASLRLAAPAR